MEFLGIDAAQIIADALGSAGGLEEGTLTKADGAEHAFQGMHETREVRDPATFVSRPTATLTIIAKSVADNGTPEVGDDVVLGPSDDPTFSGTLTRLLELDPARAVYTFEVQ